MLVSSAMASSQHAQQVSVIGGQNTAVVVNGTLAFVGEGIWVKVVDISDPDHPFERAKIQLPDLVLGLDVSGSILAAACQIIGGLQLLDISDPDHPTILSGISVASGPGRVTLHGNLAYFSTGSTPVIFNITNPSNPLIVGAFPVPPGGQFSGEISISGTTAVVADFLTGPGRGGFDVYDISNPAAPVYRSSVQGPASSNGNDGTYSLVFTGNHVYSDSVSRFRIHDLTNPLSPTLVADVPTGDSGRAVRVRGSFAYVGSEQGPGISVFNISNPASPTLISQYATTEGYGLAFTNSGLLCSVDRERGFSILDVANPNSLATVGVLPAVGILSSVNSGFPYLYAGSARAGLKILDVKDPEAPAIVSSYETLAAVSNITRQGKLVYMTEFAQGLEIVDVSDATSPKFVGSYVIPNVQDLKVVGDHAYVTSMSSFKVLDISEPTTPTLAGAVATSIPANTHLSLYLNFQTATPTAEFAYLGSVQSNLQILDVADPHAPQPIGSIVFDGNIEGVHVAQTEDTSPTLYLSVGARLSGGFNGLQIYDLADPAHPAFISQFSVDPHGQAGVYSRGFVYESANEGGLKIIDVLDRSMPTLAGFHSTLGDTRAIDVHGSMAYVADSVGGLALYRLSGARIVDAEILRHTIPAEIQAGQTVNAEVVVRNYGEATWNDALGALLAISNDACSLFGGTVTPIGDLPNGSTVLPEGDFTFQVSLTAGSNTGDCTLQLQMAEPEGGGGASPKTAKGVSAEAGPGLQLFGQEFPLTLHVVPRPNGARDWSKYR